MLFRPENGFYVFEVVLSFECDEDVQQNFSCLIQADDPEEAEEKVQMYLDDLDLDCEYRIEEISDPFAIDEYREQLEYDGRPEYPVLEELSEEDLRDHLGL